MNTDFSFAVSRRGFLVAAAGAAVSASLVVPA
ncbi:MAG: twin-arginine translocation signal domain-containing protein [Mesorhizobium sp.]|nr:MAG: twin-arginine translocation signal domain-containing protein [Mesorhizobium sp.]